MLSHLRACALALVTLCACDDGMAKPPTIEVTSEQLAQGGVYITYVLGCEQGCELLKRGDLVLALDGQPVAHARDLGVDKIATGAPVKLSVLPVNSSETVEIVIVARPSDRMPPIAAAPPFWSVGAADLDKAPQWARRNLFGHASLMAMLISAEGGTTDGRQLRGKKRLILFWDVGTRMEQAQAANMMGVLQRAQGDLNAVGVDILFTQVRFPSGRVKPLNDTALRAFQTTYGQTGQNPLPIYRLPNATEYQQSRELGMEGATSYMQYLRESPAIVLLDADGMIRWHSEGIQVPPIGDPFAGKQMDDQWTIIQAIEFALKEL